MESKAKNILFLQVLFPDIEKEETLYTQLAEEFKNQGHNVYVVTIQDYIGESNKKDTYVEEQKGLKILRVKTPTKYFNTGFIEKGITTVTIPYLFTKNIEKYFNDVVFDTIVTISIIPGLYKTVKRIKSKHNSKVYLLLRDIFPQMARDMGVLPYPIYSYFRSQQIKLYKLSDVIGCMSKGNIEYVKKELPEVESEKLVVLPNWRTINSDAVENNFDFREKYNLKDKVIAVFGGVLGVQQGLDFLLDLAYEMKSYTELHFILIGNGTEKEKLKKICEEKELKNVSILNRIPSYEYEAALKQCDIGLINLHGDVGVPHIPSKTLSYLEAAVPVLSAVTKNTDYGKVIEEIGCGYSCNYGNIELYKKNIVKLLNKNLREKKGIVGRQYLIDNLQTKFAVEGILKKL